MMARPTLPDAPAHTSLVRRIVSGTPVVIAVYAMASLALGLNAVDPAVAAVGVTATGLGFAGGTLGINKVTRSLDGLL